MNGRVSCPWIVGRDRELQILQHSYDASLDSDPTAVLIGGEVGIGKTRLIKEFADRISAEGAQLLVGCCLPIAEIGPPYAPVAQALRSVLRNHHGDELAALLGDERADIARLLPEYRRPGTAATARQIQISPQPQLFDVVCHLLERLAHRAPVVLIVEDLHWADRSTLDLLMHLRHRLTHTTLLMIVTYRGDELAVDRLQSWLATVGRSARVARVELARLPSDQVQRQVTGILGTAPPRQLLDALMARTDGNPFFVEELLACPDPGSGLPIAVRELLGERITTLTKDAQQLVRVAAAAGRQAPEQLLRAVTRLPEHRFDQALHATVRHHLLEPAPVTGWVQFRHELLRETAYDGLLPGERSRVHARIAGWLTGEDSPAHWPPNYLTTQLAYHWQTAGQPAKALPHLIQAGVAAQEGYGFTEARDHFQRCLTLWDRSCPDLALIAGVDRLTLVRYACDATLLSGDPSGALELAEAATATFDRPADPRSAALLLERLSQYRSLDGDLPGAYRATDSALALLPAGPPTRERAVVLARAAQLRMIGFDHPSSRALAEDAMAASRLVGDRATEAHALDTLGSVQVSLGDVQTGLSHLRMALQIAQDIGDTEEVMRARTNLGWALARFGDAESFLNAQLGTIAELTNRVGADSPMLTAPRIHAAVVLFNLGRWEESTSIVGPALDPRIPLGRAFHARWCAALLDIGRGNFTAAEDHINHMRPDVACRPSYLAEISLLRAELALWRHAPESARAAVTEAYPVLDQPLDFGTAAMVLAVGVRAEADVVALNRACGDQPASDQAAQSGHDLLRRIDLLAATSAQLPLRALAWIATARAEVTRLDGTPAPDRWATAVHAWQQTPDPWRAAYAQYRQVEALLTLGAKRIECAEPLRAAHRTANQLVATPLAREVAALAARARIHLPDDPTEATSPPTDQASCAPTVSPQAQAHPRGLTNREIDVLRHLAAGHTNQQIAAHLYISRKTADTHVSNILHKLRVSRRTQAAAIAYHLNLVEDAPDST
jgi:DNA-binding NarL/FixJ family response regulator